MAIMIVDICIGIRDGMVAITIDGHVEGGDYFSHGCGGYDKSKISKGGGNWLVIGQEMGGKSRLTFFQWKLRFSLANTAILAANIELYFSIQGISICLHQFIRESAGLPSAIP